MLCRSSLSPHNFVRHQLLNFLNWWIFSPKPWNLYRNRMKKEAMRLKRRHPNTIYISDLMTVYFTALQFLPFENRSVRWDWYRNFSQKSWNYFDKIDADILLVLFKNQKVMNYHHDILHRGWQNIYAKNSVTN